MLALDDENCDKIPWSSAEPADALPELALPELALAPEAEANDKRSLATWLTLTDSAAPAEPLLDDDEENW